MRKPLLLPLLLKLRMLYLLSYLKSNNFNLLKLRSMLKITKAPRRSLLSRKLLLKLQKLLKLRLLKLLMKLLMRSSKLLHKLLPLLLTSVNHSSANYSVRRSKKLPLLEKSKKKHQLLLLKSLKKL